jgi:hypothetical protein
MAKKIQVWSKYGPRVALGDPMLPEEVIENVVSATNQSKGSVLAVLAELDVQIKAGLKAGRIVRLPNGLRFEPVGKKDGYVNITVNVSQEMDTDVNARFRGKWINAENIGKSESEMIALWNEEHPLDPINLN